MKTYKVVAERSGGWWALEVPELPGVFSQVRRLDQAEAMASDAIAAMLDVDPGAFAVEVAPHLDEATNEALQKLERARAALADAQARASAAASEAVTVLTERDGLTMRDAGRVMGVSHQRIAQLVGSPRTS